MLIKILFYRQFRLCITKTSGKAHTPKDARAHHRLPPEGSSIDYNMKCNTKVTRAPSTAAAVPLPPGGRLFVSYIITQIGREDNLSAEICKHPYENQPLRVLFLF